MSILNYSDEYQNSEKITLINFKNEYSKWFFLSDIYEDSYKVSGKYKGVMYQKYLDNLLKNLKINIPHKQFYPQDGEIIQDINDLEFYNIRNIIENSKIKSRIIFEKKYIIENFMLIDPENSIPTNIFVKKDSTPNEFFISHILSNDLTLKNYFIEPIDFLFGETFNELEKIKLGELELEKNTEYLVFNDMSTPESDPYLFYSLPSEYISLSFLLNRIVENAIDFYLNNVDFYELQYYSPTLEEDFEFIENLNNKKSRTFEENEKLLQIISEQFNKFMINIMLYIFSVLQLSYQKYDFTHYDLKPENMFIKFYRDENNSSDFEFENFSLSINTNFDIKILVSPFSHTTEYGLNNDNIYFNIYDISHPANDILFFIREISYFYTIMENEINIDTLKISQILEFIFVNKDDINFTPFLNNVFDELTNMKIKLTINKYSGEIVDRGYNKKSDIEYRISEPVYVSFFPYTLNFDCDYLDIIKYILDESLININNIKISKKIKKEDFKFNISAEEFKFDTSEEELNILNFENLHDEILTKINNIIEQNTYEQLLDVLYSILNKINIYIIQENELIRLKDKLINKLSTINSQNMIELTPLLEQVYSLLEN